MRKTNLLKNKRIFVGFNHAGAAGIWQFTRILRKRGYQIDFYGLNETRLGMSVDYLLKFSQNRFLAFWQKIAYFFKILPQYDIWHLNFMEGFFFYPVNLLILKLFGKKIVLTFRGAEVRTRFEAISWEILKKLPANQVPEYYLSQIQNKNSWRNFLKRIRMRIFISFADKVILTGPFLADQVIRYDKIIPYAREVDELRKYIKKRNKNFTILHVPTEPVVKGTKEIEKIFKKLEKKYKNITFRILPTMPRRELLCEMSKADIVVDQIIVGWYGGQAVEAMAMGKIVVAYLNPGYLAISEIKNIPVWNTSPFSLEADLENLIKAYPTIARNWQEYALDFVKKYHSSEKIAQEYLKIYERLYE